jgi:hypothetical protein
MWFLARLDIHTRDERTPMSDSVTKKLYYFEHNGTTFLLVLPKPNTTDDLEIFAKIEEFRSDFD